MSESLLARQPILDIDQKTWGYELLFRSGTENAFVTDGQATPDGDHATMSVMNSAFFSGLAHITGQNKALVNFTRYLLLNDYAKILSPESVIIEILEDVKPDAKILEACYSLKNAGYTIALDDFRYDPSFDELLSIADIVKVDFMQSNVKERMELAERLLPMGITLLAEKVETHEEFIHAKSLGYTYFQGYFFSKPQIVKQATLPESKMSKLQLLKEVNMAEINVEKVEQLIKGDPGLTMRLLHYLNSAFFGFTNEITSIKQGIVLLGQSNLRKWASVLVLADVGAEKPVELLKQAIFRARFCEILAKYKNAPKIDDYFITGLLSLIDSVMDTPIETIIAEMAIGDDLKEVLLSDSAIGPLANSLSIAKNLELGSWVVVDALASDNNIPNDAISKAFKEAVEMAEIFALNA